MYSRERNVKKCGGVITCGITAGSSREFRFIKLFFYFLNFWVTNYQDLQECGPENWYCGLFGDLWKGNKKQKQTEKTRSACHCHFSFLAHVLVFWLWLVWPFNRKSLVMVCRDLCCCQCQTVWGDCCPSPGVQTLLKVCSHYFFNCNSVVLWTPILVTMLWLK